MNLEPFIWFLKSGRMKVRGDKPYASSLQGSFKKVPTLKNSLVSFDFIEIRQDRQEARIGNKPIENRIWTPEVQSSF